MLNPCLMYIERLQDANATVLNIEQVKQLLFIAMYIVIAPTEPTSLTIT